MTQYDSNITMICKTSFSVDQMIVSSLSDVYVEINMLTTYFESSCDSVSSRYKMLRASNSYLFVTSTFESVY